MPWETVERWTPGGELLTFEHRESRPSIRRDSTHYVTTLSQFVEMNLNVPIIYCRRAVDFSHALDRWFQARRSA